MGFNYARERRKFETMWKKIRKDCLEAGMSENSIAQLYQFDLTVFRSDRRFENHTQTLPESFCVVGDGSGVQLIRKFRDLCSTIDEAEFNSRYAWIDTIESPAIIQGLKKLGSKDIEVLTLYVLEGYSQQEIADMMRCNQSVVSRRIGKIKRILRG